MANTDNLGIIITVFTVILIGVVFAGVIGNQVAGTNTLNIEVNETFTWVNNTAYTLRYDQIVDGSEIVTNSSATKLTKNTHYTIDYVNGKITITNNTNTAILSNPLNISHTFRPDQYVNESTSRPLLSLVNIFWAIAVLLVVVGAAWIIFKQNGFV